MVLVLAVIQVALAMHVRNTIIDSAAEGARYAAAADRDALDGVGKTRQLISSAISSRYAEDITVTYIERDGLDLVEVSVSAPLPVIGMFGPSSVIKISAHALVESP